MIVLDANVIVKLFVREDLSEQAHALARRYSLFRAPELVRVEVSSAITRKLRNGELDESRVEKALARWTEFRQLGHLRLDDDGELLSRAERLSLSLRHPLADCLYLAASARHNVPLVTADGPFCTALGSRFPHVHHLGSYAVE